MHGQHDFAFIASRRSVRSMVADVSARSREYVHSWNGKHRRPADMLAANFHADLKTDLLWVYEGLTQYLGLVVDARSGFWTKQQFRDELAVSAGGLEVPSRRAWRSVLDTAIAEPMEGSVRGASWRTQSDFYYESVFIWLEADTIIRKLSHGQRSLDDFCQSFSTSTAVNRLPSATPSMT